MHAWRKVIDKLLRTRGPGPKPKYVENCSFSAPAEVAVGISNRLLGELTGLGGHHQLSPAGGVDGQGTSNALYFQPVRFAAFVTISIWQLTGRRFGCSPNADPNFLPWVKYGKRS